MQHYRTHVLKMSYTENGRNFFLEAGSLPILSGGSWVDDDRSSGAPASPSTEGSDEDNYESESDSGSEEE
ncbi:hypothetical protein HDV00_003628 [Rhizophlyctis rosea]|nr:hypothetical protein HDV00_003628 [Rhizophlyctis rosea]